MVKVRWHSLLRLIGDWSSTFFLVLLIIVPACIFIWLLFFTKTFSVSAITIVDARPNTESAIRELASTAIGNNMLFMKTDTLERTIYLHVPQVKNVHIVRKLPETVKIIVQERTPVVLLVSKGAYYFLDKNGVAYEEASLDTLPGTALPTIKNLDTNTTVTLGTRAVDEEFIAFLQETLKEMPAITNGQIVEVQIPSLATREAHFLLDKNWTIKMDTTRPANSQLDVLSRLLDHTISGPDLEQLQYIDLRIQNRVYYKSRNSTN